MQFSKWARAALVTISLALAVPATGQAAPHKQHKPPQDPMAQLAAKHGWGAAQVQYEWLILGRESTSSPGHLNLSATNGRCWGSGQLSDLPTLHIYGPTAVYRYYHGNYATVRGQETADLNYIIMHGYGNPENAWAHEEAYGWY